ncbi:MAG: translation initiation factor IF-2, partial [Desulfovibrionaceae bacterium]|nr:translation initiation factor IF-2 [Desulfovibrionaceae bacterium]
MILAWAAAGALLLVGFIYSARVMKRGITTLDEARAHHWERIQEGERQLQEDRKNIPLNEHVHILRVGVEDLLHLAGDPPGFYLEDQERAVVLHTPNGPWRMELFMREALLRGSGKTIHGQSRWLLSGFGHEEHYEDIAGLMHSLHDHLRGDNGPPPSLECLARHLSRKEIRALPRRPS